MPVQSPALNSNRGFSLIELVIAGAIMTGLALSAVSLGGTIFKPLQDLTKNIYESLGSDISVRSFGFQFSNSDMMRGGSDGSPWITCSSGSTALPMNKTTQSVTLAKTGDTYTFGYAQLRTLGATNPLANNTINVPDTGTFRVGMNLLVTSLDPQKNQGIFSVVSIDNTLQTITLADKLTLPPATFGCKIIGRGNSSTMFNPLSLKKFSVEVIALVKYEVADMPNAPKQLRLLGHAWPSGPDPSLETITEIVPYLISMQINETFTAAKSSSAKGIYQAAFTINRYATKISGKVIQTSIAGTAGYNLSGIDITNQAAVPAPPSVDNLFVTCGISATPMLADFIDKEPDTTALTYGKVLPVYRVDVAYTESDVIDKSSPAIATAFSSTAGVRCWRMDQVDCSKSPATLNGPPVTDSIAYTQMTNLPSTLPYDVSCIDTTDALVVPMFCDIPSDAQTTTKLNYTSTTAGDQSVNCSSDTLPGLKITYSYNGTASHCSLDGSVFLGRLVNGTQTGPVLGIKTGSCKWTGSASTSCNAFAVLSVTPAAKLKQVTLTPEDIQIQGGGNPLTCN